MDEAGIAPGPNPPALAPDELMSAFGRLPLMHQPGQRWLYHTSFDILGVLIARAAGDRFEDFLAARIFAPLGMKDTAFGVPEAKRGRLAACYQANAATGGLVPRGGGASPSPQAAAPGCSRRSRTTSPSGHGRGRRGGLETPGRAPGPVSEAGIEVRPIDMLDQQEPRGSDT